MKKYIVTGCCESIMLVSESEIYHDELGEHISLCPYCKSSCNIEYADDLLLKNGTRVMIYGETGEVFENDMENTDELKNINYGIILDKDRSSKSWHDVCLFLPREDFDILN